MPVSKEEVRHVAQLARLRFSEEEIEEMTSQLGEILDYMSALDELDTSGVPPMTHVLDLGDVLRKDEAEQRISREDALRNVPKSDDGYVLAPNMLE